MSPFARLPEQQRTAAERDLLTFYRLCVQTSDDDEERWSYEQLVGVYREAIAGEDDLAPTLMDALRWAAGQDPMPLLA